MNPHGISAAILAGGLGTRLREAVPDRQKVIAQVAGKPFLNHILKQLITHGFEKAVLCTGYRSDQVREVYGSAFEELDLCYSQEKEPLGTAGALRFALKELDGEFILLMNGDSYCETNISAFIEWHFARRAPASLLLTEIEDCGRYGSVKLTENSHVASFVEKGVGGPGLINAGIYLINRRLVEEIPESGVCSLEKEMFPRWAAEKHLYGYKAEVKAFIDIGTPESLKSAAAIF